MKQDSYIQALYYSFYSKAFYRNVAVAWKGLGFGYLLFILCLLWVPETSRIHSEVSEYISAEAPGYVKQVPVITIAQGKVSVKERVPYFINIPGKNTPFAIIDTSGSITSLDKTSASVLLTGTQLIVKNSSSKSHVLDLKGVSLVIDQKVIYGWLENFDKLFPIILFPFVLFSSFLFNVIQVLLSAGIGTLFAKQFRTNINYKTLVRLSAVSFTPAVVLQTVHALLDIPFPYRMPISFLISLGYLYYAVGSNSETSRTAQPT
jgi:hypothetical protein